MDELSYLIIESGINDDFFNRESLINLYPREPKFIGYDVREIEQQFVNLMQQNVFLPVPRVSQNFVLSDKGRKAFLEEKQRRKEKVDFENLQKSVSESVLNTNQSVLETNESVKITNSSIRALNDISVKNFKVQNKIARAAVIVSAVALLVAIGSFKQSTVSTTDPELLRQLQEMNRHLEQQNRMLDSFIKHLSSSPPSKK